MRLHTLEAYPRARCTDGTTAGFYFSAGGSSDWIVLLESGGWCWDEASCASRCASTDKCSSTTWAREREFRGIFASSEPRLANANKVYSPSFACHL